MIPAYSKTPADSAFYGVCKMMKAYSSDYNSLPQNWEEFIKSGYLSGSLLDDARMFCDIENRYFFLNLPVIFDEGITRKRIIVMGKQSGGEGDITALDSAGVVVPSPGRYLIVETIGLGLESGRFSERRLQGMFEKAGLNLKDYTFDAPPASAYSRRSLEPNSEKRVLSPPESPSDGNTRAVKNSSQRENKPRSPHAQNDGDSTETTSWAIWIGIAAIGVLALAWVLRRYFLSRSLRKT